MSNTRAQIEFEHKHGASMRSDMVRIGMGVADIRFRAQFCEWKTTFNVRYQRTSRYG